MSKEECSICRLPFDRYTVRRSLKPAKKKMGRKHFHYGMPFYKYGICEQSHYTKLERTRVDWAACKKCEMKEDDLSQRRRYIEARKRKENKEIPTFIRKEFDRFGTKIKNEIRKEIRDEVRAEVRAEVRQEIRAEIALEMDEKVKWQVEKTINRILKSEVDYPMVPSPPSPPSSIFSQSE